VLLSRELHRALSELQAAHAELDATRAELTGLAGSLPLCLSCRKVRTAEGSWRELHAHLVERGLAEFGYCHCPDCERVSSHALKSGAELGTRVAD
jgi:hypothetical protein